MESERKVVELRLEDVLPNRFQPRIIFDENSIMELSESIKEHGVIQPIVVRRIGDKYEIIAGERRYKASVIAGKQTIPAIVTELNDKDSVEIALIENVQRENLTPIEEAISYKKILDMGYLNQEKLAEKLGKTQSTVANKLRLLNLDEDVQEALLQDKISERHARSLLKLKDQAKQREMLQKIISERLTVRKADEEIDKMIQENNGNQSPMFNFNMPTSPIIDDNVQYQPVIDPINAPTVDPINVPGFMDVEKIEQQAQPIYTEKPLANVGDLLKSDFNTFQIPTPIEIPTPTPIVIPNVDTNDTDEGMLRPGKFFNILDDEDEETLPNSESQNNLFEPLMPNPMLESVNSFAPSSNIIEPLVEPASIYSFEPVQVPEPVIQNTFKQPVFQAPITPQPTVVPFYGEIPDTTVAIEPAVPIIDDIELIQVPTDPQIEDLGFSSMDSISSVPNINISSNYEQPVFQAPIIPQSTVVPFYEQPQVALEPIMEPVMTTQPLTEMKDAVAQIRTCADQLEKMGFEVDLDEFDLEDMYQVIIKIDKK